MHEREREKTRERERERRQERERERRQERKKEGRTERERERYRGTKRQIERENTLYLTQIHGLLPTSAKLASARFLPTCLKLSQMFTMQLDTWLHVLIQNRHTC